MALTSFSLFSTIFFFNDTATTEIYTLSLHDALPISAQVARELERLGVEKGDRVVLWGDGADRSEEHTSELQSQSNLVCRLLLEKKKMVAMRTRAEKRDDRYVLNVSNMCITI